MLATKCNVCNRTIERYEVRAFLNGKDYCVSCYEKQIPQQAIPNIPIKPFNEPDHYHQQNIDTIQFLQEGFPPEVFKGFAIGSAIKYLHRFELKNGYEDLDKAEDYIKRLREFCQRKDLL